MINVAMTSMSSKLIGSESKLFGRLCFKAINYIKTIKGNVSLDNIHIVKMHGKSTLDTKFFQGFVMRMSRVV
jgi:chaperonin GroEL (HSP60 family)